MMDTQNPQDRQAQAQAQDQEDLSEQVRAITNFLEAELDGAADSVVDRPRSPVTANIFRDPTSKKQCLSSPIQVFRVPTTKANYYMEYEQGRPGEGYNNVGISDAKPALPAIEGRDSADSAGGSTVTPSSNDSSGDSEPAASNDSATTPSSQSTVDECDCPSPAKVDVSCTTSAKRRPGNDEPSKRMEKHIEQLNTGSKSEEPLILRPGLPNKPTAVTVELAAAAKIYLETYFNELLCGPTPRARRAQHMENWLYTKKNADTLSRRHYREAFYRAESNHLRETRVLNAKSLKSLMYAPVGTKLPPSLTRASDFQLLKVLGKGSFGTVRLVREKLDNLDDPSVVQAKQKQTYAMKVIRKSNMIKSGQEGHLRAERDFLVAAEGSNWYALYTLYVCNFSLTDTGLHLLSRVSRTCTICIWSWNTCQAATFCHSLSARTS